MFSMKVYVSRVCSNVVRRFTCLERVLMLMTSTTETYF